MTLSFLFMDLGYLPIALYALLLCLWILYKYIKECLSNQENGK